MRRLGQKIEKGKERRIFQEITAIFPVGRSHRKESHKRKQEGRYKCRLGLGKGG